MTTQEIQNAQQTGRIYANDNYPFIYESGMTAEKFGQAALNNYNANADAYNLPSLPEAFETDFIFGAKNAFRS